MMNFLENITFQYGTRSKTASQNNMSQVLTETFENNSSSLADISKDLNDDSFTHDDLVIQLKLQIEKLTLELHNAHDEIELLSVENSRLKFMNEDLKKSNSTPSKEVLNVNRVTQTEEITTNHKLNTKNKETQTLKIPITPIKQKQKPTFSSNKHVTLEKYSEREEIISKICIISEDKNHRIYSIADDTLGNPDICHYRMPNCGINNLLYDLDKKLIEFTKNDFCIILIGDTDFNTTKDYLSLVTNTREILQNITHTNIIICTPTYKHSYYATMFNCRVEHFNNLLYTEITSHRYAYYIDSNKNLTCDYKMFAKDTGFIKYLGIKTIFKDLSKLIMSIKSTHTQINDTKSPQPQERLSQFFL